MDKKRPIILLLVLGLCFPSVVVAEKLEQNDVPQEFRMIIEQINEGIKNDNVLAETNKKLEVFIRNNPDTIWADDAQYINILLTFIGNPQENIKGLEQLLENYPNFHIESWTKNNSMVAPQYPLEFPNHSFGVKVELLTLYKMTGDVEKFNLLYNDLMQKYPMNKEILERIKNLSALR